ncbi:hypothetical protein [Streptomyces sp. NBC_01481]|nr:hypothetical protein [Streptomyces sp. NBC_01481]MCX4586559.1 hypothetical protein [Streptomyces sp. NBC_01481]
MAGEFWRTIRKAIEKDNWTARLVVVLLATGAAMFGARICC